MKLPNIKIKDIKSRTIILCSNKDERNNLISFFNENNIKKVGLNDIFDLAPNIDYNPISKEYQTIIEKSFLINKAKLKNSKINIINAHQIDL